MNENKNYLQFLKIALYIVAIGFVVIILWKSKTFFDKNYSKHEILESDSSLYKVENENQNQDGGQESIQLIEQQPVEVHTEVTTVVTTEMTGQNVDTVNNNAQNQEPASSATQQPPVVKTENASTTNTPQEKLKKTEPKKDVKKAHKQETKKPKEAKTESPKTLTKAEPVSESVIKNPLFYSYVVQVGAFSNIEEAKKYQEKIANMQSISGFRSDLSSKNNIHRVFVGYFESHASAENLCLTLKKENVQCFVTKL